MERGVGIAGGLHVASKWLYKGCFSICSANKSIGLPLAATWVGLNPVGYIFAPVLTPAMVPNPNAIFLLERPLRNHAPPKA